ncbi:hypothetical protein C8034_v000968 [Colletotrichum sidae]|uniref:Uncharacterized protein n=1 Tax=Colletotrichum sidae TaxID=1347389 RepID=A0A4R8SY65_9PEZI|nr:hypothetical protein C8034_v000968 [Colletotrichum sidae]
MLISTILTAVATAPMIFAPVVLAAREMQIIKYGTTDCSRPGGPVRDYHKDECINLYPSDHAMKIKGSNTKCKLTTWDGRRCQGRVVAVVDKIERCTKIAGSASGKVECS